MTFLPPVSRFESCGGVRVYRIGCRVFPHLTARVFLVLGAGAPTLVDVGSGQGSSSENILAGIEEVRDRHGETVSVGDIRRIILTHGHIDHFGGLAELTERMGSDLELCIHPLDRDAVVSFDRWALDVGDRLESFLVKAGLDAAERDFFLKQYRNKGQAAAFYREDSRGFGLDRVGKETALGDDMALDGMRFIHTPGHSPGHVCVLIDDVLLCGDHILPRTLPQQWPESVAEFTGVRHYLQSLDKVERIEGIRLAAGGHEPVMPDVYRRIDDIRRSQKRRFERVEDVIQRSEERLTLQEIGRRVYTKAEGFFALLALTDVGARVEHLEERGRLRVEHMAGVAWVSPA